MALSRSDICVGDILDLDARGKRTKVKVLKINPKNIKLITEDGTKWNASPSFLHWPKDKTWTSTITSTTSLADFTLGVPVRFKNAALNKHPLYVITGTHGSTFRIAALGGDGGRYYRGITAGELEIVNFNLEGL